MSDPNDLPNLAALATLPQDEPVVMVNLLAFGPDGGLDSYRRYAAAAAPHLERVGATVRYGGVMPAVVLGEGDTPWWDAILLVEYPTPAAFMEMVTDPGYRDVHRHRADALVRGDLIGTAHWSLVPPAAQGDDRG